MAFNDQDPLKIIALKLMKVFKNLLMKSGIAAQGLTEMPDPEAYNLYLAQ